MVDEEQVVKASNFIMSLRGQSFVLGFVSAILLTEIAPFFKDLRVIPALILVFFLYKIFMILLIAVNYKHYRECVDILLEYLNQNFDKE